MDFLSVSFLLLVLLSSLLISKRVFAAMNDKPRAAAWIAAVVSFVLSSGVISFALTLALLLTGVFHR